MGFEGEVLELMVSVYPSASFERLPFDDDLGIDAVGLQNR